MYLFYVFKSTENIKHIIFVCTNKHTTLIPFWLPNPNWSHGTSGKH